MDPPTLAFSAFSLESDDGTNGLSARHFINEPPTTKPMIIGFRIDPH